MSLLLQFGVGQEKRTRETHAPERASFGLNAMSDGGPLMLVYFRKYVIEEEILSVLPGGSIIQSYERPYYKIEDFASSHRS